MKFSLGSYRTNIFFTSVVLIFLLSAGCSSSNIDGPPATLEGRWELIEMKEKATLPEETYLYINRTNGSFQTSAGCNTFNGGIEEEVDESIEFKTPTGTKKYCAELTEFETSYIRLLTGVKKYQIRKNVLQLYNNSEVMLAYRKTEE